MCGKRGIATFWGKSVVRGKNRLLPFLHSSDGVMSPPAIYLTHTYTYTHLYTQSLPIKLLQSGVIKNDYAIDNGTIDLSNNATRHDGERRPGIEPGAYKYR